eukprot:64413-Chlamydomonas_euryale.AAC.1
MREEGMREEGMREEGMREGEAFHATSVGSCTCARGGYGGEERVGAGRRGERGKDLDLCHPPWLPAMWLAWTQGRP